MDEFIKREDIDILLQKIEDDEIIVNRMTYLRMIRNKIKKVKNADVAPVVHGIWEIIDHYPYPETIRCSVCGREFGGNTDWIRCPLCEARMDGE